MTAKDRFLREYPKSLIDDVGTVFIGAGVSMAAGYPSWAKLLKEIGEELGVKSSQVHDLAALAQWSIQETGGATQVRGVIRQQIGPEHPIPEVLGIISRLPVRHIWTTNYDRLIERAFSEISRPIDVVSGEKDLSVKPTPGAVKLYKMHGSVDRLDDVVISTDDYELYRRKRGAYLPLLQAHLTSTSMLFIGLSLTDPNIRHVLSVIRESFTEAPPEHFAIVKPPKRSEFDTKAEFDARSAQHRLWARDLRRYGLIAVEIADYDEVPTLLAEIERRVASHRAWVSGSWPIERADAPAKRVYEIANRIGLLIGKSGKTMISGAGLTVGSASMAGFLDSLRPSGGWDLDRRLIARPFPQPFAGEEPDRESWRKLRIELARIAGTVFFVGGTKEASGELVVADGVLQEFEFANAAGAFLVPIAGTGGAAREIYNRLRGSKQLSSKGSNARRPSNADLDALADPTIPIDHLTEIVKKILSRSDG